MNSNQVVPINIVIEETPQVETIVQDGLSPVSTIINAPWVNVTSVNGKTGDVIVNPVGSILSFASSINVENLTNEVGGEWSFIGTSEMNSGAKLYHYSRTA